MRLTDLTSFGDLPRDAWWRVNGQDICYCPFLNTDMVGQVDSRQNESTAPQQMVTFPERGRPAGGGLWWVIKIESASFSCFCVRMHLFSVKAIRPLSLQSRRTRTWLGFDWGTRSRPSWKSTTLSSLRHTKEKRRYHPESDTCDVAWRISNIRRGLSSSEWAL